MNKLLSLIECDSCRQRLELKRILAQFLENVAYELKKRKQSRHIG